MKKFFTIVAGLLLATSGASVYAGALPTSTTGPNANGVITSTFASVWDTTTDGSYPDVYNDVLQAYVTDESGTNYYIPFKNLGWTSEKKSPTVTFDLSDIIVFNGKYTLTVPAGLIMVMETMDYDSEENDQYTYEFNWTIGKENTGTEYIPTYSVNDNVVNVTWSNVTSLAAGTTKGATLTNNATQVVTALPYEEWGSAGPHIRISEGNKLRASAGNVGGATSLGAGNYTLYIPAGFVKFNGGSDTNAEIDYQFNLVLFDTGEIKFYGPAGKTDNPYSAVDGVITVEFGNISSIKPESMLSGITVNGTEVAASNISVPAMPANIININISGNAGLKNGENTLLIGGGNFNLKDNNSKEGTNPDLEYTFNYSGVGQKDPTVEISFNLEVAADYVDAMDESELPQAVTISYTALKDGTYQSIQVPVEGSLVSAEFPYGVTVDIAPVGKYMITKVANYMGDLVIEEQTSEDGQASQGVGDYDAVWSFTIPESPTFTSTFVSVEVGVTPANVYMNFVCNDPDVTSSASDLVTINYGTSVNHVATDNGYRVYLAPNGSTITVTPIANYEIKDVTIRNANNQPVTLAGLSAYGSSYSENNGAYSFVLGNAASGLTFLFDVEPTTKQGTDIAINFGGEDLMAFAWTFVTTKTIMANIDVDNDNFIYTYTTPDEALDLYFIPESGYSVSVECVRSTTNAAYGEVTAAPAMGTGAYQVAIPVDDATGVIPEDVVINVTVSQMIEEVTVNFVVSNGDNKIENPGEDVTVSYKSGELQGSVDVSTGYGSVTMAAGSVITITPAEGAMVSDITSMADDITVTRPIVDAGAWTVTIPAEPSSDFATIFITVDKDTSSINSISTVEDGATIFNLQGVKVNNPDKGGIYIINGKKVVVK